MVGAGRAWLPFGSSDHLEDRALTAMVGCSVGPGWALTVVDEDEPGWTAFVRPYRVGAGPTTTITAGAIRWVDAAHASWPTAITEAPMP